MRATAVCLALAVSSASLAADGPPPAEAGEPFRPQRITRGYNRLTDGQWQDMLRRLKEYPAPVMRPTERALLVRTPRQPERFFAVPPWTWDPQDRAPGRSPARSSASGTARRDGASA